jgi:hypothetical protein
MTQFNIGSQHAGNITNIGGDATIGHQQGAYGAAAALAAIDDLRRATGVLEPAQRAAARQMMDELEDDVQRGETGSAAIRLRRLTDWLARTGALAAAGAAFVEPLARIARVLGPVAESVLRQLPL